MTPLTGEQEQAAARRGGSLLLAAGAGSGKTAVLAERFVRAVREDGIAPGSILAITFTERAAGELRERIRLRLVELRERDAAREAEAAYISTFHGFCARLLRAHPLPAGLDPDFAVLDEGLADRLRRLAFRDALAGFVDGEPPEAVDLVAAYGADALQRIVLDVHARLRSQGQTAPRLPAVIGEQRAVRACRLIGDLLRRFGAAYTTRKRARAAVDFDDLELLARDLLEGHARVRQAWSERFQMLMVDEFQDTNPRQLQLLELLDRDNLFTVGDELQSIYGFRHAQVGLFRERHDRLLAAGAVMRLTHNFRSSAPILVAVDRVFAPRIGERYTPLVPAREGSDGEPRVELLLTDCRGEQPWREREARLLAGRVAELVQAGEARPGDVAVLLRALGDLPLYEAALRQAGLPTLAAVGGFWGHRQVGDLVAYLRALANPLDELALYSTLASPLVGLSSDALALIAMLARERRCGAWEAIERHAAQLDGLLSDAERLAAFRGWFAAERRRAPLRPLAELPRRAIAFAGYDTHLRSLQWAERRMANVHKLLGLARAFEAQEGRDLRGFLDHVAHLGQELGVREAEAPLPGEDRQAVQLMSIHATKGLEFPVVCVSDLGRAQRLAVPDLLVGHDGRVGLRLPALGDPAVECALDFEQLRDESQVAQQQEEDRILYVAMTRARDRLLLSGAADFARWPAPRPGGPPVAWLAPALVPDAPALAEAGIDATVDLGGGLRVRCTFGASAPEAPAPAQAPAAVGTPAPAAATAPTRAASGVDYADAPLSDPDATISYSSLAELERCGYRYYLERVLRLGPDRAALPAGAGAGKGGEDAGPRGTGQAGADGEAQARARGTVVHALLEALDFARPRQPTDEDVAHAARRTGARLDEPARAEIVALIEGALAAGPARRLAATREARREHPFAFSLGPGWPLVVGVFDLIARDPGGATLVVDYKSDRLAPRDDLEQIVAREYGIQRLVYALAALQAGAERVQVAHWFLERPAEWASAEFAAADGPSLSAQLTDRIDRLRARGFQVAQAPHRGLCLTCPGRRGLCSWDESHTLREPPCAGESPAEANGPPDAPRRAATLS